jgi:hypothetical protein
VQWARRVLAGPQLHHRDALPLFRPRF